MKKILLDTNTILNAIIEERKSVGGVEQLFKQAEQGNVTLLIPTVIFFELEWVLRSFYKKDKQYITNLFTSFLTLDSVEIDQKSILLHAVNMFVQYSISLVDCYILTIGKKMKADDLETNDHKLKRIFDKSL